MSDNLNVPQTAGSNASEFVRKLHRMLEDPSHQDVARWSKEGDTFLVVEGEKFTRSILPKHFKHSNMSSFIRQLNKYDFHKVKPTTDSDGNSLSNVLEFKHPYFHRDNKEDLDNIRRKAPASRNKQQVDEFSTQHHISVISEQLSATQQQVQQLQELYTDVSHSNKVLINEVLQLQRTIKAQKQASHEIVNYLTPYDGQSTVMGAQPVTGNGQSQSNDDSLAELQRARDLLQSVPTETITDRELERLQNAYGSPTDSNTIVTPSSMQLVDGNPMHDITRYPIYPVGQTVGIDPFHSDHIHKIPYAMPNDAAIGVVSDPPISQAPQTAAPDKNGESMWGSKKPRILLVEDDPTCTKIGMKFLKTMGCEVEHAVNGADAYSRMSNLPTREYFDMIFMDIIMPMLDGVSATLYIRQNFPAIPVIAMTSNIRPEEVNGYFEHGMNGVLAKPFTKDGMHKSVRTHLGHLMKNPPPESDLTSGGGYFMGNSYLNPTAGLKYDAQTPPANSSTWSPGLGQGSMGGGMDQGYGFLNGSNQYTMATGHRPTYSQNLQSANSSTGHLSDVDSPPEKRQRLNPQY